MVGGALAGALADASGAAACVSAGFVAASVPALVAYRALGARSLAANLALMAAAGLAVNGPYALITTAVSADLGSHRSLAGARPAPPRPPPPPPALHADHGRCACRPGQLPLAGLRALHAGPGRAVGRPCKHVRLPPASCASIGSGLLALSRVCVHC